MPPHLRIALRRLRGSPEFSIIAVVLLAVSIAGPTLVFSLIRGLLLQATPYSNPDQVVVLKSPAPRWGFVEELSAQRGVFAAVGAYTIRAANLSQGGPAERILAVRVDPAFLPIAGAAVSRGRLFRDDDFRAGHDPVVLITDKLWHRRYGGAEEVIGSSLTLDGRVYLIVGVLRPDFITVEEMERAHDLPFGRDVSAVVPLRGSLYSVGDPTSTDQVWRGFTVVGRLRAGVSVQRANSELAPVLRGADESFRTGTASPTFAFASLSEVVGSGLPSQLALLSVSVGLLLLAGCANVANLMFARIERRARELAICTALGCGVRGIVATLLAETAILSACGAAAGLFLTREAILTMKALAAGMIDLGDVRIDVTVLAFASVIAVVTTLAAGVGPAVRSARRDPASALQLQAGAQSRPRRVSFSLVLVATQVAVAVMLVVVSAALARAFVRSLSVNPGYAAQRVLSAEISLDRSAYWRHAATRFFDDVVERLRMTAGVERAALVSTLPGGEFEGSTGVKVRGAFQMINASVVSSDYFSVLSIPMLAGRDFTAQDTRNAPDVVVVNESFARQQWGTPDRAIGKRIGMGVRSMMTPRGTVVSDIEHTIVGVVANSRDNSAGGAPLPKVYWNYKQSSPPETQMTILVRSSAADATTLVQPLIRTIRAMDPEQPVYNVLTLSDIARSRFARERMMTVVMTAFAVIALIVSALGIHAAMVHTAALRRHEVGVRLALGGTRAAVLRAIALPSAKHVFVGLELGLVLAVAAVSFLRGWLFGAGQAEVPTIAVAVALVVGVAAAALLAPAWRATRVDPLETMRAE